MTDGYCVCLLFLTDQGDGRVELYPDCPQHWRAAENQPQIPRDSSPADADELLDLIAA